MANTQYRKNLKAVLEASKSYCDESINNLKWELGTYDLGVDTNTDTAHIKTLPSGAIQTTVAKVEGVGYKVNQLVANGNFDSASGWSTADSSLSVANNKATINMSSTSSFSGLYQARTLIDGHKYFVSCYATNKNENTRQFSAGQPYTNISVSLEPNIRTLVSGIFSASVPDTTLNRNSIMFGNRQGLGVSLTFEIEKAITIDLTTDFGSGNEPSTVSDCATAYLQRGINIYEYTPQQSSIKNNAFTGVKVEGFNKWDEEWELGSIQNNADLTNAKVNSNNAVRSKNAISIIPNTTYYSLIPNTYTFRRIGFYDKNGGYVGFIEMPNNSTFTTPNNAYLMLFTISTATTYQNDICINISGSANGTYVPYIQPTTISVDLTTIKDSNNVSLFPSGKLMGNSSVADFITPTNQESRWDEVDLGDLTWSYASGETYPRFTAPVSGFKMPESATTLPNVVCPKYDGVKANDLVGLGTSGIALYNNYIYIRDTNYTDATVFKNAMNGIKLQYERETPLTSNTDLTSLVKINVQSNGTITLNNTDNVDMPNTIKSLKEVAK